MANRRTSWAAGPHLPLRGILVGAVLATAVFSGPPAVGGDEYHTPLAGKPYRGEAAGIPVDVPARDRDNIRSLNIGTSFFTPEIGNDWIDPFGALYWRRSKNSWRSRGIIGIFDNEIDVAREWEKFQLIGHLDNYTLPTRFDEILNGQEINSTSIRYGTFNAGLGAGWRVPIAPFQADNALRLSLLYTIGYLYTGRVSETDPNMKLPPSTLVQGFRLRADCDRLLRNIMELPHDGWAAGLDVHFAQRSNSGDSTLGGTVFSGTSTRKYVKTSAFFTGATGVPSLSERHRLVGMFHGGYAPRSSLDRFSAFRISGGPVPDETDDFYRLWYPGATFEQFPASDFIIGSLEYRYEILFFLYLHLRFTAAEMNHLQFRQVSPFSDLAFVRDYGETASIALTSGLPWNSQIYAEYTYDTGILRDGESGSSFLMMWSKAF